MLHIPPMSETVTIAARYNGPPKSGNGGYACGLAARFIDGPAEVSLRAPPPLDTALDVVREDARVLLRYADKDVAIAKPAALDLTAPPAPDRAGATRAAQNFLGHTRHTFPGCFVCGQNNPHGLRIFNGPVREGLTAAPWTPAVELAAKDGMIGAEFLWAALDCPSYWALPNAGDLMAVLGRLTASIDRRPKPGEQLTVAAWPLSAEGKKHSAASAIYDEDRAVIARAEALWIEVDPERFR